MTKNRLDSKIKEVFEKRTLVPSDKAWKALEKQLERPEASGGKRIWWYGIAAGFIGILLITVFLRSRDNTADPPVEGVVNSQIEPGKSQPLQEEKIRFPEEQKIAVSPDLDEFRDQASSDRLELKWDAGNDPEPLSVRSDQLGKEEWVTRERLDIKVAEVVAQIARLEESGDSVEDAVIDSLLRAAQQQLLEGRATWEPERVDAMALLSDVEGELNQSVRDQLFEKLKEGYLKVRTAVAYRNE